MKTAIQLSVFALLALASSGQAQGTAFTYQGRLNVNGQPATGIYDMTFVLSDADNGPHLLATNVLAGLSVTGGLFTVTLDFGAGGFDGGARWLEIGVRTNGSMAGFAALTPRQPLTPSPYAHYAYMAATVTNGAITGTKLATQAVTATALSTPVAPAVGQVLTYNGASLDWRSPSSTSWSLTGNAGTSAGANSLGTLDPQPLELRVNGARVLRLEPDAASPNLIGGASVNYAGGARGATIGGGGSLNFSGFVLSNSVSGFYGTIAGGLGNTARGFASSISGGFGNTIDSVAQYSCIAGGNGNSIQLDAQSSGIASGHGNLIMTNASFGAIGGGQANTILTDIHHSTIAGGQENTIGGSTILLESDYSSIGGGFQNVILNDAPGSTIGGGHQNTILAFAPNATIGGGNFNVVQSGQSSAIGGGWGNAVSGGTSFIGGGSGNRIYGAEDSAIVGGSGNAIEVGANSAAIGGGYNNRIRNHPSYSTIGGGTENTNAATSGTIAGGFSNLIQTNAENAAIGGGSRNNIGSFGSSATIGGGYQNTIGNISFSSTVAGGAINTIHEDTQQSTISGGYGNTIQSNGLNATIGGGAGNTIEGVSYNATIGGGTANTVQRHGRNGAIGGGGGNTIQSNAIYATISGGDSNTNNGNYGTVPGGANNEVSGNYGFAAGRRAKADFSGDFVWADSTSADFHSTAPDQFLIRASSGVGINTNNPGGNALSVAGSARITGLLRSGSETGTAQPPNPAGLVVRRVNSTSQSAGQVIARTDVLTLERDGTPSGLRISYTANADRQTVSATGINYQGTTFNSYTVINAGGAAGSGMLYADLLHMTHVQISFGNTYNAGHVTQVVLDRYDDGVTRDNYWIGTLTSTFNQ